ncbi:GIY-YIG nuclease family protein [Neptunitalea lumnitzerae]|uniref:GIY-YIG nuclease family protein n=1 Tax=Neptunitalea lumnitzerae TaxID=2965509 RepID=A0ABQ5MFT2_9FLAO|nr:hypothetical protein [Neptunitalea sp. Y10]GLB48289.1 hypothetical protein Y10_06570 [Neptunitalea sp. Y10]
MKECYVYILGDAGRTSLTTGYTTNLEETCNTGVPDGSSLLYYETFRTAEQAAYREGQLKSWKETWRLQLVSRFNPALEKLKIG